MKDLKEIAAELGYLNEEESFYNRYKWTRW